MAVGYGSAFDIAIGPLARIASRGNAVPSNLASVGRTWVDSYRLIIYYVL